MLSLLYNIQNLRYVDIIPYLKFDYLRDFDYNSTKLSTLKKIYVESLLHSESELIAFIKKIFIELPFILLIGSNSEDLIKFTYPFNGENLIKTRVYEFDLYIDKMVVKYLSEIKIYKPFNYKLSVMTNNIEFRLIETKFFKENLPTLLDAFPVKPLIVKKSNTCYKIVELYNFKTCDNSKMGLTGFIYPTIISIYRDVNSYNELLSLTLNRNPNSFSIRQNRIKNFDIDLFKKYYVLSITINIEKEVFCSDYNIYEQCFDYFFYKELPMLYKYWKENAICPIFKNKIKFNLNSIKPHNQLMLTKVEIDDLVFVKDMINEDIYIKFRNKFEEERCLEAETEREKRIKGNLERGKEETIEEDKDKCEVGFVEKEGSVAKKSYLDIKAEEMINKFKIAHPAILNPTSSQILDFITKEAEVAFNKRQEQERLEEEMLIKKREMRKERKERLRQKKAELEKNTDLAITEPFVRHFPINVLKNEMTPKIIEVTKLSIFAGFKKLEPFEKKKYRDKKEFNDVWYYFKCSSEVKEYLRDRNKFNYNILRKQGLTPNDIKRIDYLRNMVNDYLGLPKYKNIGNVVNKNMYKERNHILRKYYKQFGIRLQEDKLNSSLEKKCVLKKEEIIEKKPFENLSNEVQRQLYNKYKMRFDKGMLSSDDSYSEDDFDYDYYDSDDEVMCLNSQEVEFTKHWYKTSYIKKTYDIKLDIQSFEDLICYFNFKYRKANFYFIKQSIIKKMLYMNKHEKAAYLEINELIKKYMTHENIIM